MLSSWFYDYTIWMLGCTILLLQQAPFAQGAASIDQQVTDILQEYGGVGLTAWSVNGEGHLCSLGAAGERIKDSGEPFVTTGDSRHHIGSVTKSITSTLLAILIEDGTIPSWSTSLQELLSIAKGTAYENVTLGGLASHASGMAFFAQPDDGEFPDDFDINDMRTFRRILAEAALFSTPVNEPGTAFLYSNWGYIVAGHIIEEQTNMTWEESVAKRLFEPLGIDLGDDPSDFTGAPNNSVDPWGHSGLDLIPCDPSVPGDSPFMFPYCDFLGVGGPAGTFSGPVAAMARYFAWHIQCHNGEIPADDQSATLLSQESCRQIHQPFNKEIDEHYGYGWNCTTNVGWAEGLVCNHVGSNDLNLYEVWMVFDMDRAFVAYTNGMRERNYEPDYLMLNAAIKATVMGNQECDARIPSTVYATPDETSESYRLVGYSRWCFRVFLSVVVLLGIF